MVTTGHVMVSAAVLALFTFAGVLRTADLAGPYVVSVVMLVAIVLGAWLIYDLIKRRRAGSL